MCMGQSQLAQIQFSVTLDATSLSTATHTMHNVQLVAESMCVVAAINARHQAEKKRLQMAVAPVDGVPPARTSTPGKHDFISHKIDNICLNILSIVHEHFTLVQLCTVLVSLHMLCLASTTANASACCCSF